MLQKIYNDFIITEDGIIVRGLINYNLNKVMSSNQFPIYYKLNNFYYVPLVDRIIKVGQIYNSVVFKYVDSNFFFETIEELFGLKDSDSVININLLKYNDSLKVLLSKSTGIRKVTLDVFSASYKTLFDKEQIKVLVQVFSEEENIDGYYFYRLPYPSRLLEDGLGFMDLTNDDRKYILNILNNLSRLDLSDLYELDTINGKINFLQNLGFNIQDARKFIYYTNIDSNIFIVDSKISKTNLLKYFSTSYQEPKTVKYKMFSKKIKSIDYIFKTESKMEEEFNTLSSYISLCLNLE